MNTLPSGRDLGHEDMAFIVTASTVGDLVDQEDASFRIQFPLRRRRDRGSQH